jgi:hypothetical protein
VGEGAAAVNDTGGLIGRKITSQETSLFSFPYSYEVLAITPNGKAVIRHGKDAVFAIPIDNIDLENNTFVWNKKEVAP